MREFTPFIRTLVVFTSITLVPVHADDRFSPRTVEELGDVQVDQGRLVEGFEFSFIDEPGLASDHPEVARAIKDGKVASWEAWLRQFVVISQTQLDLGTQFNSPIQTVPGSQVDIHRNKEDGRSGTLVAKLNGKPVGLMGVKGIGNRPGEYFLSGLLSHAAAVAETDRQRAVQRNATQTNLNNDSKTDYQTVPIRFIAVLKARQNDQGWINAIAVVGRQATVYTGAQDIYGYLPKELGLGTPLSSHQASASGALSDYGVSPVTNRSDLHRLGVPASPTQTNDMVHTSAGQAVARFEAGDKKAVARHLERPEWNKTAADAIVGEYEAAFAEDFWKEAPTDPSLTREQRVLQVYLHTHNPRLRDQLQFSLAAYFQRRPDAFSRAIQTMRTQTGLYRKAAQAVDELRMTHWRGATQEEIDAVGNKWADELGEQNFHLLQKAADNLAAHLKDHFDPGQRRNDTPLERSLGLVRRAVLDHTLYPYGGRYHSGSTELPNLIAATHIPEDVILFARDPGFEYRSLESARLASPPDQATRDVVHQYLQLGIGTETAHPLDYLLPEISHLPDLHYDNDVQGYNAAEMIRRISSLFDQVGDPPITSESYRRLEKLAQLRAWCEKELQSKALWPQALGAFNRVALKKELALLALRLGSEAPAVKDALAELVGSDLSRVERARAAAEKYTQGARTLIIEQGAAFTVMGEMLKGKFPGPPINPKALPDLRADMQAKLQMSRATIDAWPYAISKTEFASMQLGNPTIEGAQIFQNKNVGHILMKFPYQVGTQTGELKLVFYQDDGAVCWENLKKLADEPGEHSP